METLIGIAQPIGVLISVMMVIAAVFLFKLVRGWDTILMMVGSVISFASQILHWFPELFTISQPTSTMDTLTLAASGPTLHQWYFPMIVAIPMLGGLLFATGFVGYVVRLTIKKNPPNQQLHEERKKRAL